MPTRQSSVRTRRAERAEQGKALRQKVPRPEQAKWKPPAKRRDLLAMVRASDGDRIPALVAIRLSAWIGVGDGVRSGAMPDYRYPRASVRGLPPDELRCLRHAGAKRHLRHQRLR